MYALPKLAFTPGSIPCFFPTDERIFYHEVEVDLIWIEGEAVLHICGKIHRTPISVIYLGSNCPVLYRGHLRILWQSGLDKDWLLQSPKSSASVATRLG